LTIYNLFTTEWHKMGMMVKKTTLTVQQIKIDPLKSQQQVFNVLQYMKKYLFRPEVL